jgi:hypothetical protein
VARGHSGDEQLSFEALLASPGPADPTTPEGWVERLGQTAMATLLAEERVFSEMVWTAFPSETDSEENDEAGWTPLLPDSTDLAQGESEDRHT